MQPQQSSPDPSSLLQVELKMQREAFEEAGFRAHSMGISRSMNPYVRTDGAALRDPRERQRLETLAAHWWDGWDSRQARVGGRRK